MTIRLIVFLLAAIACGGLGLAQQVRPILPIGTTGPAGQAAPVEERGVPPHMFENPNLDRYLRRAQFFLDAENYVNAIEVLQDVIQGRTVEFLSGAEPAAAGAEADGGVEGALPPANPTTASELDAANSVFSLDGRIYRPVRRLCHELLARLPLHGIELYRTLYEVAAQELLDRALANGSVSELEQVVNRYFVTVPAGQAMGILADRFMHEGRYRAAVQVLRDLIDIYPRSNLQRAGIDLIWCKFKIALCLRMAGEPAAAQEAVRALAKAHAEDSLRILGELQSVRDFPAMGIFATDVLEVAGGAQGATAIGWLDAETARLVPLWHYRFVDDDPYRLPDSEDNSDRYRGMNGQTPAVMPFAHRYGPASWIRFVSGDGRDGMPRALFLDHYRLRVADLRTGILIKDTEERVVVPDPKTNYPRVRIAACDHALLRPVEDEERRYVVIGHNAGGVPQKATVLEACELIAYQRRSLELAWTSKDWLDGPDGLRDVTFLAAPTVFGERLLLPARRGEAYSLECLDRVTGRPQWHAMLHAEGSEFFKAPGAQVELAGGTAYVLTNAGCLAAVDAFAGSLDWIRRYERDDPLRPGTVLAGSGHGDGYGRPSFAQAEISGFFPNDLIVRDGLVVFAPCDGTVLFCLDGASGEVVWLLDGQSRYAPYGELRTIVGATAQDLFVASADALVCLDFKGGLVKWYVDLPKISGKAQVGRGRGTIIGDHVVLPGDRELLVYDAKGPGPMRRLRLPPFGVGREPLPGPFNVVSSGPWLGVGYQGGVEVFSSERALRSLAAAATDLPIRASYLVAAGDRAGAERVLREWLGTGELSREQRVRGGQRLLALVRERVLPLAVGGQLAAALAGLDDIADACVEREVRQEWHLARIEVCKEVADLSAYEHEQQRLYDFMEGRTR